MNCKYCDGRGWYWVRNGEDDVDREPCECGGNEQTQKMHRMKKDFESYLIEKHAAQYEGLDDGMPDDYEDWLQDLDIQDVIVWANEWAQINAGS